jgi:hypothetical protein
VVAATPGRRAVAVWKACPMFVHGAERTLYAVRDTAGTWTDPGPVPFPDAWEIQLVTAGEQVFLMWYDPDGLSVARLEGNTWGGAVRIASEEDGDPVYNFDGLLERSVGGRMWADGDRVAVAWDFQSLHGGADGTFANVFDGGAWSGPVSLRVDPDAPSSIVDVASGGGLTVLWMEGDFSDASCYARTYGDAGWGEPVRLAGGTSLACLQMGLVGNDRGSLAYWFEGQGESRTFRVRSSVGGRWGEPVTLAPAGESPAYPVYAAGVGATFLMVARPVTAGPDALVAWWFDGARWTEASGFGDVPFDLPPQLTPGAGGYLLQWRGRAPDGEDHRYVRVFARGAWGEVVDVTAGGYMGCPCGTGLPVAVGDGFTVPVVRADDPARAFALRYRPDSGWMPPEPLPAGEGTLGLPKGLARDGDHALAVWTAPDPDADPDLQHIWAGGF